MKRWSFGTIGVVALAVSGCAGGASDRSAVPPVGPLTVLRASAGRGAAYAATQLPDLSRVFPNLRRRRKSNALQAGSPLRAPAKTWYVDAYLSPSYASTDEIYRSVTVPAPKKGSAGSLTVHFPNAPVGNNEFATFEIYGSQYYGDFLGDLAAFVNVTKAGGIDVVADEKTTLAFQAEMAMIVSGLFTADDLKAPDMEAKVEARIKSEKLKPNRATGLFGNEVLSKFVSQWAPAWRRTVTFTTGSPIDLVTYTNDATDTAENILKFNETDFLINDLGFARPPGAPCYTTLSYGRLGAKHHLEAQACVEELDATGGNEVANYVYGGPIIVGQVNDLNAPYQGTLTHVPARPPRATTNLGTLALESAEQTIATYDPFDWAFGTRPNLYENYNPGSAIDLNFRDFQYSVPTGWSAVDPGLPVLSWNPAGLRLSDYQVCTWRQTCVPLNSKKTLSIDPPFSDPGTAFGYYAYTGSAGVAQTSEPAGGCTATTGYHVSYPGTSFTLTTTKPVWFTAQDEIYFAFSSQTGCNTDPTNMTITLTAEGVNGVTYVNSGTNFFSPGNYIIVRMSSMLEDTPVKSLTISISGAPTTALDFDAIGNEASP